MTRRILIADRGGWELALDNPDAVVVDLHTEHLRRGSAKHALPHRYQFAFLCFLLRGPDVLHERAAIAQAIWNDPTRADKFVAQVATNVTPALAFLEMTLETAFGRGVRLHSAPMETLPCSMLAPGQKPPTHVSSRFPRHAKQPLFRRVSRTRSAQPVRAHRLRRTPSSPSGMR